MPCCVKKGKKIMESRVELAVEKKHSGMNCAQAVACAYCDIAGMDEATMAMILQGFGSGIGATMEGNCGAITGACAVIGLLDKEEGRAVATKDCKMVMKNFLERNGAVTCKALKGIETRKVLRECDDCVRDASEFLEKILAEKEGR